MVALAAGDVTYTVIDQNVIAGSGYKENVIDITFGDSALTYTTGGIPLTKSKLGLPNTVRKLYFMEDAAGNGFIYKYDESAEKLVMYYADYDAVADGALIEVITSVAPAAATLRIVCSGW